MADKPATELPGQVSNVTGETAAHTAGNASRGIADEQAEDTPKLDPQSLAKTSARTQDSDNAADALMGSSGNNDTNSDGQNQQATNSDGGTAAKSEQLGVQHGPVDTASALDSDRASSPVRLGDGEFDSAQSGKENTDGNKRATDRAQRASSVSQIAKRDSSSKEKEEEKQKGISGQESVQAKTQSYQNGSGSQLESTQNAPAAAKVATNASGEGQKTSRSASRPTSAQLRESDLTIPRRSSREVGFLIVKSKFATKIECPFLCCILVADTPQHGLACMFYP